MIALLLASLLQVQATVSYTEPAAPLSRVMPALSKLLNEPLDVAPNLKTDVVCIDVHDVTPKDLLDRLAWATVGEWEQKRDGTIVLEASEHDRMIQSSAELKRRVGQIVKYLNPPKTDREGAWDWWACVCGGSHPSSDPSET